MKTTKANKPIYLVVVFLLMVLVILSIVVAVTIGSSSISITDVYGVIFHKIFGIGAVEEFGKGPIHDVIWFIRLPRIILAIAVGMSLAVCGVVMQAIVKNPLADPYILGISSGASLGATVSILLGFGIFFGENFIGVMAFIGAFAVSIMVLTLSNIGGRANSVKLLLAGMALSAVCSAFSSFAVYLADDKNGMMNIAYWLMGSLAGADWDTIVFVLPFTFLCTIFFSTQSRTLNLMLLGDEVSITLGTQLHIYRHAYLLLCAAMIGFVVYCSGMIGFVGLIIPHIARMLFGTDHKKLIPISALLGAILLVWADVLCRIIIPNSEIPIGILISMIGAPFFVYMMIKKTYGFGGNN